jgi:hypothetical protein
MPCLKCRGSISTFTTSLGSPGMILAGNWQAWELLGTKPATVVGMIKDSGARHSDTHFAIEVRDDFSAVLKVTASI